MMRLAILSLVVTVIGLCVTVPPVNAQAPECVFPDDAGAVNIKTAYGAAGDGKTDDTAAIQKAVDENRGKNRTLYFPNGVYLLSDGVGIFGGKPHSSDRFLTWQGQSEAGTVIKLKDNAEGFGDGEKPKIVVSVYQGQSTGDAMHSYVRNLTIDVGVGNPGAVGLRFMTNNIGMMERVTIRSSDPKKVGAIGLDLRQSQNGPGLIKHVTVDGFKQGVATDNSFSLVLEHITLRDQSEYGFYNKIARVTLRGLKSQNKVPAVFNGQHAHMTLIDAQLTGGAADQTAIITKDPKIYLRDIRQTGYGNILEDSTGKKTSGASLSEWHSLPAYSLFDAKRESLRLPIRETPEIPWETDLTKWVKVEVTQGNNDITQALQQAIDDAARTGKTTLYFTNSQKPVITGPIRIHGSINRIVGMQGIVNVADPNGVFKDGTPVFTFEDLKSDAIVIERFFMIGGWNCPRHATIFANKSGKTIVLKNLGIAGLTKKADPGGTWFIEDVSPSRYSTLQVGKGETIWARQYNPETPKVDMIHVDGGRLWILGLKTEGRATHVVAENGAKVEVIGGVAYQSWGKQELDPPLLKIIDSDVSMTLGFYHHDTPFATIVEETRSGETRSLSRQDLKGYHLPLYRSGGGN